MVRGNFRGKAAAHCKVYRHSTVSCVKTVEPIEVPFGIWIHVHIRDMLSPVRRLSICNARAPYSGRCSFRQCFYAIWWYLGHPLTSAENFTQVIPEETLCRGVKRKTGSQI